MELDSALRQALQGVSSDIWILTIVGLVGVFIVANVIAARDPSRMPLFPLPDVGREPSPFWRGVSLVSLIVSLTLLVYVVFF